jgi:hypothetical protein
MNSLPALYPGRLHLLLAASPTRHELVNTVIVRLACGGPLRILDGGNCFQAHRIARLLRRQTSDLQTALGNIHIARAFTCYQSAALLAETPALPLPVLALDLLTTFYDENTPLHERQRLMGGCLSQLRRLSYRAPVLVSTGIPAESQPHELLTRLEDAADQVWRLEAQPPPEPLRLF